MTFAFPIVVMATCLLLQGFFSGSEMALVNADLARLEGRAKEGHVGAEIAVDMLTNHDEKLLGTCLIGTNICLIAGTTVAASTLISAGITNQFAHALAYVPFALLIGEALPKEIYRHHANTIAPVVARPIRALMRGPMLPFLKVLELWWSLLRRVTKDSDEHTIRREDIFNLLGEDEGRLDPEDQKLIQRLLATRETTVEACMTPLVDVYAIRDDATVSDATELVLRHGHSRLPVFHGRIDNIVALIDHRDLLFAERDEDLIVDLARPAQFVPESKRVDELLREMLQHDDPIRVVVDEYGGSVGLVTIEDLFEEVVGEIEDERDAHTPGIRMLSAGVYRVPARTPLDELEEELGFELPHGSYETVAGLILDATGRIPAVGEMVEVPGVRLHVEAANERAVRLVRVVVTEIPEEPTS